jgi:hypothetical protein
LLALSPPHTRIHAQLKSLPLLRGCAVRGRGPVNRGGITYAIKKSNLLAKKNLFFSFFFYLSSLTHTYLSHVINQGPVLFHLFIFSLALSFSFLFSCFIGTLVLICRVGQFPSPDKREESDTPLSRAPLTRLEALMRGCACQDRASEKKKRTCGFIALVWRRPARVLFIH